MKEIYLLKEYVSTFFDRDVILEVMMTVLWCHALRTLMPEAYSLLSDERINITMFLLTNDDIIAY